MVMGGLQMSSGQYGCILGDSVVGQFVVAEDFLCGLDIDRILSFRYWLYLLNVDYSHFRF
jgi:hypothetical protein